MRNLCVLILLSGCAAAPISTTGIPVADLDECTVIAEKHGLAGRAAARAAVEGARGTGVAYTINQIPHVSVPLWPIFAGYAITSAINGAIEAQDRRDAIVRECLRDRGLKVY